MTFNSETVIGFIGYIALQHDTCWGFKSGGLGGHCFLWVISRQFACRHCWVTWHVLLPHCPRASRNMEWHGYWANPGDGQTHQSRHLVHNYTITNIVNLSLGSGTFHPILKESTIFPFLKKSTFNKDQLSNYRPISNLSLISKIIYWTHRQSSFNWSSLFKQPSQSSPVSLL